MAEYVTKFEADYLSGPVTVSEEEVTVVVQSISDTEEVVQVPDEIQEYHQRHLSGIFGMAPPGAPASPQEQPTGNVAEQPRNVVYEDW